MTGASSHSTTQGLVAAAKDAFADAFRGFEQLQTIIQEDSAMWSTLHGADDSAENVTRSVAAAFEASDHGAQITELLTLAESVSSSTSDARIALNQVVADAENGKTSARHGMGTCEDILAHLAATGNAQ